MKQINNLSKRITNYSEKIQATINRVLANGWLILGPEVKQFEQDFAAFLGCEYCISVANGTDALELALKAMGINRMDYVATVANAGMYATNAILAIGAEPIFMDINSDTYVVSFDEVVRVIDAGVKAIIVTHLYGLLIPEIEKIVDYCRKKGVLVLEDCAQVAGAHHNNKRAGSFGDAASFSFYPTKNLAALGDGGAVVTNNSIIADKLKSLRQYGWSAKYQVELGGGRNSRLDEIQAAILSMFLPELDHTNARRREIAALYNDGITHPDVIVPSHAGSEYVAHLYVIRTNRRDDLRKHLHQANIATDIHYPIPDYRQQVFGNNFSAIFLENTELVTREILTLPCYPELSNDEVNFIINAINSW
ncbi:DegT/DnrJ/EryC1/StrS family aminotransferase [Legionella gresilensis]|uniref:DegT/DnrJ/EryC1/StrS family aminotransferase n=1 Tax=Legionella gresilensis TaxID=91823 RepID=UPI0010416F30|nr:DegT/DnrJ/EryC1/StrS family aminotransferase [Legionella gresilensis]